MNNMSEIVKHKFKQTAGVFIDIDGVVLQGGKPYEWSKAAIHRLWDNNVPFVFVTNGTYSSVKLIESLTEILGLPFSDKHVMVAPSPCRDLIEYHERRVLVCCQDDSIGLISELGFTNAITVSEFVDVFPELDYVDHEKRKILLETKQTQAAIAKRKAFEPIEAVLLLGEPINWECSLQIILDVLMTNGDPRTKFKSVPSTHLPIIACNKDLTFKGAASLPRFGHGAFLNCLESVYAKVTKNELVYKHLMGKPYMVTYEYARNHIQKQVRSGQIVNKFFIIGDNPEVDVKGANLYKDINVASVPKPVESILVCTGVYNPQNDLAFNIKKLQEEKKENVEEENGELKQQRSSHVRKSSFVNYFEDSMNIPDLTVNNLNDAVDYILKNL